MGHLGSLSMVQLSSIVQIDCIGSLNIVQVDCVWSSELWSNSVYGTILNSAQLVTKLGPFGIYWVTINMS